MGCWFVRIHPNLKISMINTSIDKFIFYDKIILIAKINLNERGNIE